METLMVQDFTTKFNKQELLEKFSNALDRAEEIAQNEDFIKYKNKYLTYINEAKTQTDIKQLSLEYQELCDKLKDSIQFDNINILDGTAFMIALAGNNWL